MTSVLQELRLPANLEKAINESVERHLLRFGLVNANAQPEKDFNGDEIIAVKIVLDDSGEAVDPGVLVQMHHEVQDILQRNDEFRLPFFRFRVPDNKKYKPVLMPGVT